MLKYTITVRESTHRGKYRYGILKIETSDLLHLAGQKVHVLVLQEEEYRQLMDTLQGVGDKEICSDLDELEETIEDFFTPGSTVDLALSMYEEKKRQELAIRTIYRKRGRKVKTTEEELDKVEIEETRETREKIQELKKKLEDLKRRLRCS